MPTGGLTSQFQNIPSKERQLTQIEKNNFRTLPVLGKTIANLKEQSQLHQVSIEMNISDDSKEKHYKLKGSPIRKMIQTKQKNLLPNQNLKTKQIKKSDQDENVSQGSQTNFNESQNINVEPNLQYYKVNNENRQIEVLFTKNAEGRSNSNLFSETIFEGSPHNKSVDQNPRVSTQVAQDPKETSRSKTNNSVYIGFQKNNSSLEPSPDLKTYNYTR